MKRATGPVGNPSPEPDFLAGPVDKTGSRIMNMQSAMPDIVHSVTIHGRPESVYRAVATAEGIRGWWTRDAALEPRLGGPGQFGFNDGKVMTTVEAVRLYNVLAREGRRIALALVPV